MPGLITQPQLATQSGVLPYRLRRAQLEVLLVTNTGGRRWLVPKGNIEPHLSARQSALKEAWEEAGVDGHVDLQPLGCVCIGKKKRRRVVCIYPMRVTVEHATWKEMHHRRRRWAGIDEAIELVRGDGLRECLRALVEFAAPIRLAA